MCFHEQSLCARAAAETGDIWFAQVEQKKINLNDVEDMQDDMEELMAEMNDISDVMGRSYGLGEDVDEAELDAELAMFEVQHHTHTHLTRTRAPRSKNKI
jgi:SMC interacting uncharacterized protein involved in chromosome segregation